MTRSDRTRRVAYVLEVFPAVSQLFILREMLQVQELGYGLTAFSVDRPAPSNLVHQESEHLATKVIYLRIGRDLGTAIRTAASHVRTLLRNPARYAKILAFVLSGRRGLLMPFIHSGQVAAFVQRQHVQHIHAHFAREASSVAMLASMLTGTPYSFTVHARDIFVDPHYADEKLASASCVVAISDHNAKVLPELCKVPEAKLSSRIRVIHLGVPVQEFESLYGRTESKPLGNPVRLLTVARMVPKKGHRYLLEALAILRERRVGVRWVVAGGGPEREHLVQRAGELGLSGQIDFIGDIDSTGVKSLLAEADLFVLPSIKASDGDMDGIPVALMEAFAAGVPVISTPVSGIAELVTDGISGLLVEPENAGVLADAIECLLDDPTLRERLRESALARVRESFDLETNVRELVTVFSTGRGQEG